MKKNTRLKLGAYSVLAGSASFLATDVEGQIVHKNFNPDTAFSGFGTSMDIDLNADGNPDFRFNHGGSYTYLNTSNFIIRIDQDTLQMRALNGGHGMVMSSGQPATVSSSYLLNNTANWNTGTSPEVLGRWYSVYIQTYTNPPTQNTSSSGNFFAAQNELMGLRVMVCNKHVYGWARITIPADCDSMYISEMAYQAFPGVPIEAGATANTPTQPATAVVAGDVSDNGDGSDLQVAFTRASNETGIAEYRIYVVKSAAAATFNIDSAKCVPAANYTAFTPTGSNYLNTLAASANDVDGAAITNGVAYKVFVVSIPDGQTATSPAISGESNEVTLNVNAGISESDVDQMKIRQTDDQVIASFSDQWVGSNAILLNVAGQNLREELIAGNNVSLTTSDLASGVYVLRITNGTQAMSRKFIVR